MGRLVEVLEIELEGEEAAMAKELMKTYGLDSPDELVKKLIEEKYEELTSSQTGR